MNLKDVKKWWRSVRSLDPYEEAACTLCGATRKQSQAIVEGQSGYVCDRCPPFVVSVFAAREGAAGKVVYAVVAEVLRGLDAKTPHAQLDPIFDAASILAAGDPGHFHDLAFLASARYMYYARNVALLGRVPDEKKTVGMRITTLAALLSLERRDAIAHELAAVEASKLTPTERVHLDAHRAWAAFRLEGHGTPTFAYDPADVPRIVAATADLPAPLKGQALEVQAALERTRDPKKALTIADEALAVGAVASSRHLLRGDILHDLGRDAREAWKAALDTANPDSVWAERARKRLEGRSPYREAAAATSSSS
jgi:hypothetical protein